eukprot:gb/GEZN01016960.1/.p1 GENE.gb/GEZN01016960.1/~~gb/GEZN01016960.1/.p1  ORF type:complete len:185 (-),score=38.96 gb/GEZN01016960.1/:148-702(-)
MLAEHRRKHWCVTLLVSAVSGTSLRALLCLMLVLFAAVSGVFGYMLCATKGDPRSADPFPLGGGGADPFPLVGAATLESPIALSEIQLARLDQSLAELEMLHDSLITEPSKLYNDSPPSSAALTRSLPRQREQKLLELQTEPLNQVAPFGDDGNFRLLKFREDAQNRLKPKPKEGRLLSPQQHL